MGTLRVAFLSGTVLELAATLGIALVAVVVGVRLVEGGIGFEAALTVLVLAPELYLPLRNLAAQFHASADGRAVAERMLGLVEESQSTSTGSLAPPSPLDGPIRFEGVSYAYPAREGAVLDELELELAPGETVALVGPSGGGKSTIAALLLGLAEPTGGRITVVGRDLATLDVAAWRTCVGWVPQRPTLFRGRSRRTSVSATRQRTKRASSGRPSSPVRTTSSPRCRSGTRRSVGDGGRRLSTGQVRRLALARAFLRDPALLILDEPTADLDPESVAVVAAAVEHLRVGRTVLLIAHRPELAATADRIVLLEGGRALEHTAAVA